MEMSGWFETQCDLVTQCLRLKVDTMACCLYQIYYFSFVSYQTKNTTMFHI